ncbi:hypothetical protein QQZ08_004313 [Neonectria magnoliae]|uniref:Beta-mannosidase-like galactose-binding domain-containing protein n=1 Tax=Neonectria magnoliae TaxID=2732573 RepID=A0ABR1I698_9HYPO
MHGYTLLSTLLASATAQAIDITSEAGQKGVIPNWDLQTSSAVENVISASKTAVGELEDSDLWYSDNLNKFNWGQFSVPWVYRNELSLTPGKRKHSFLEIHGIASRADLYLNGKQIADKTHQTGSFGGHTYDITEIVAEKNTFFANVYPSAFNQDLVQGFVDWNPKAPDNSTGIWRDVVVKQTRQVAMGPLSISIDLDTPVERNPAIVTVHAKAQNLEHHEVQVVARSVISNPSNHQELVKHQTITLDHPYASTALEIVHKIDKPEVWWPKAWDKAEAQFGIRTVTSHANKYNDTMFTVNGYPFQVLGGGYSPDHFFRWDWERFVAVAQYALDMGLNTIRLEGTMEHPELYEIADEMGVMIIAGWVCCSKWESWDYNEDLAINPPTAMDAKRLRNSQRKHEARGSIASASSQCAGLPHRKRLLA